jgi:putative component of toxin-antitoxin plasmid stabilization module
MTKEIIEYEIDGKSPYRKWYKELKRDDLRVKIGVRLARVEQGNYGDTSNEGGGIIALRFIK